MALVAGLILNDEKSSFFLKTYLIQDQSEKSIYTQFEMKMTKIDIILISHIL